MTADERLIRLGGTFNLRDTGGYAAASGRTRWRKLYRSDSLHNLSDADRAELRGRGIGLVVDLRDDAERAFAPSRLDGVGAETVHVPVLPRPSATYIASDASLDAFYDDVIDRSGRRLASAIGLIARSADTPVLVHCTAGKDRTGLVVALALATAGVSREDVVADYSASERNLPAPLLDAIVARLRAEVVPGAVNLDELVRLSPARVLTRTFARIEERHGSVEAYLVAHGLGEDDAPALRDAIVEPG